MGTNAVPVITNSLGGNANPFDPSHNVIPGSRFHSNNEYCRLRKNAACFQAFGIGFGTCSDGQNYQVTLLLTDWITAQLQEDFGDPLLQLDINILGPKAIMNIPDMLRYKPGFSVDIVGSLAIPLGEYDNTSPINLGQNRWYGRIGAPIVWQLGPWVPGKRTTIELLPAVWFFSDNNDFVGMKMETEPMYQIEGHLTRDFMERLWGSFDVISISGGKATIDGVEGNSLNNLGMGGTLGYQINDNMQLIVSYNSTVNDNSSEDLKMDGFRVTFIYGWHKLIEGMRRLNGNN